MLNHSIFFYFKMTRSLLADKNTAYTCLASLSPLCSFSHLALPPWLPPSLPSPTVFLSVSCLESQPAGQPRARKFVSGSAVEREATCSGGSGASALTWGLFLTVDPRLLFQARPLWRDDQPGNTQGAEGCSFLCDTSIWWRLLVWWGGSSCGLTSTFKHTPVISADTHKPSHTCLYLCTLVRALHEWVTTFIPWPLTLTFEENSTLTHLSLSNKQLLLVYLTFLGPLCFIVLYCKCVFVRITGQSQLISSTGAIDFDITWQVKYSPQKTKNKTQALPQNAVQAATRYLTFDTHRKHALFF